MKNSAYNNKACVKENHVEKKFKTVGVAVKIFFFKHSYVCKVR